MESVSSNPIKLTERDQEQREEQLRIQREEEESRTVEISHPRTRIQGVLRQSVPTYFTESFVSSTREESTSACLCENKPCSCGRMNGVNGHPFGFILPAVMTAHAAALSSPPDLVCLHSLQALSPAHFYYNNNNNNNNSSSNNNNNNSNIDNNHNTNNCNSNLDPPKRVTTSPQVSSSNQTLGADRRRKNRGLVSRPSFSKSDKSSSNPDKYSQEKKHRCEYCGDCFGYKHVLQNHVRTHTGEKPFQCSEPECGKRFTRDHHLKTHMRLHTGEKPYKCEYCDQKFVQVANLRRHMRFHTGERPYQCDFGSCQAKFSYSNQLSAHRHTHEEPTTIVMIKDEVEEEVKPIPRSVFDIQEEPEDLSLKKSRLVS